MAHESDGVKVSYADFMRLCNVNDREHWMPGVIVRPDGVWVDIEYSRNEEVVEHAALTEHPDGDPSQPIIRFPCTLGEFRKRVWEFFGGGFIKDEFVLADFVAKSYQSSGSEQAEGRWPWGAHHTKVLAHLEAAANKFWKHYEPSDATTAVNNDVVEMWLIQERGVSGRIAKVMATILRADGLATGPRK